METQMHPGLILSRDEGQAARDMIFNARQAGHIDLVTAVEMATDVITRTVPSA
jgi:hypothetical protein